MCIFNKSKPTSANEMQKKLDEIEAEQKSHNEHIDNIIARLDKILKNSKEINQRLAKNKK